MLNDVKAIVGAQFLFYIVTALVSPKGYFQSRMISKVFIEIDNMTAIFRIEQYEVFFFSTEGYLGGAPCAVRKVGCFPSPVATGPRVLKSAPPRLC